MRRVFADANYWIGLFNRHDQLHAIAVATSRKLGKTRLVTSEMVMVEVLNGLAEYISLRASIIAAVDAISADPNTEVVPQTALLFRDAYGFYRTHQDKKWGLTDCSSFIIMRQQGITEALTYDHHFQQAGFRALLREDAQ
jgi:predicted nucleic acid-binding protein